MRTALFVETTTIGLREHQVTKRELARTEVLVEVAGQPIRVKTASLHGAVVNAQPEFDDVAAAARTLGRPVKGVLAAAVAAGHADPPAHRPSGRSEPRAGRRDPARHGGDPGSDLERAADPGGPSPAAVQAVGRRRSGGAAAVPAVADRSSSFAFRDRVLTWPAPLTLLVLLITWLLLFLVGYGLLVFAVSDLGLRAALREAGSSLFTLGFASTDRNQLTAIDFAAALTGPIIIGLQVGYLPALYSAYNRREAEVTLLDSRAGEPNWGPEILARHAAISSLANLDELFRGWERWAADVSESHSNYPVLIFFRSQKVTRNWLVGLLSVHGCRRTAPRSSTRR